MHKAVAFLGVEGMDMVARMHPTPSCATRKDHYIGVKHTTKELVMKSSPS